MALTEILPTPDASTRTSDMGYTLCHYERDKLGGGVAFYYRNYSGLVFQAALPASYEGAPEFVIVELVIGREKLIIFCSLPLPLLNSFFDTLFPFLPFFVRVFITDNINHDLIRNLTSTLSFRSLVVSLNLKIVDEQPIYHEHRESEPIYNSCLDLFITRREGWCIDCTATAYRESDFTSAVRLVVYYTENSSA